MDMKIGDLCWAKMKGFPSWPGKIIEASDAEKFRYLHKKKLHHYIYFFGSNNNAWVPAVNIKPNSQKAIELASKKKSKHFQKAIQQLKRNMIRNFDQELEAKYCRQGIIKKCMVRLKRLNVDIKKLKKSHSLILNEVLSPECNGDKILDQPQKIKKIDGLSLNVESLVNNAGNTSIECQEITPKKFGFIGCGELGKEIAKNLLKSKCDITIWNETSKEYGLSNKKRIAYSFPNLIAACDVILCYMYRENDVQSIFNGNNGILQSFNNSQNKEKGLVLFANVDVLVSAKIASSIHFMDGKYLIASLLGSKMHATTGELLILCSGNESLFHDCGEVFTGFKRISYLGPDIELAPKLNTIMGLFLNSIGKSYNESRKLMQKLKLSVETFNDMLKTVMDENSLTALCFNPLERVFDEDDRIKFFLENLNLNTLFAANFSTSALCN